MVKIKAYYRRHDPHYFSDRPTDIGNNFEYLPYIHTPMAFAYNEA